MRARRAVVSNASAWDTEGLLPEHVTRGDDAPYPAPGPGPSSSGKGASKWQRERADFAHCPSFMHVHAGVDASKLPAGGKDLEMHHIYVEDWAKGITAPQNCVLVSIPSVVDPSLAPEGKHVIHAYTPGNEP